MNHLNKILICFIYTFSIQNYAMQLTPLHEAAMFGDTRTVKELISQKTDLEVSDVNGSRPLHLAAFYGHTDIVKLLLGAGAKANTEDKFKGTPLHAITSNWKLRPEIMLEVVELLVAHGANANARDDQRWTPLYLAAVQGEKFATTIEALKKAGAVDARPHPQEQIKIPVGKKFRGSRPDLGPCPY